MDFYEVKVRKNPRKGVFEIFPDFLIEIETKDLMIRGGDFYAVYDESTSMWNRNPKFVQKIIDQDLWNKYEELRKNPKYEGMSFDVQTMRSSSSGSWNKFIKYVKSQPDSFHQLDEKLIFQNTEVKRTDYASKRLPYSLQEGDISAYEELVTTLYSPEERAKFEWAIGSIISGDSKKIQKFIVFYGPMGSGKSTVMNIIEKLFGGYKKDKGYCAKINAKALVGNNIGFALEPFARSPLVGIDQDSKLSKIEDNTILNQIVSHDTLQINEKFKNLYEASAGCFLFMGTNEPVKITDSKSGVIRRLIDVEPTGNLISPENKYEELVDRTNFELGAIAKHCLDVYKRMGRTAYSGYRPTRMMVRTDPFFNFMKDNLETFELQGGVTAVELWKMYRTWCNESGMEYTLKRFQVLDEAKNYFEKFEERPYIEGKQLRNWYSGLKMSKFTSENNPKRKEEAPKEWILPKWLRLEEGIESNLDIALADYPAQYGDAKPTLYWRDCKTKLRDLDTHQTHYVQGPPLLIHMDFDKKNEKGEKDFMLNAKAASAFPETYAELSKGGQGIHTSYWYDGDPDDLSRLVEEGIEIKVQKGDSALRRRLSKCNNLPIAHISSGLPLRSKKVVNDNALKDAKHLRTRVLKALRKEIEPGFTTTCMNYIEACLEEAQEKGIAYDLMDLDNAIYSFAASSSHNSKACVDKYFKMKLIWPEPPKQVVGYYEEDAQKVFIPNTNPGSPIVFCDIEVAKNLLLVCYKERGPGKKVIKMFNPNPVDLEKLFSMRLAGYNCRTYDAPILYARYIGYSLRNCWELSQDIIVNDNRAAFQRDSENLFDIDIYDYSTVKQSLKKWEIQLAQEGKLPMDAHMEMNVDWNEDIPEDLWPKLAEYCEHDVIATEAVFEETQGDFKAHEILAELSDLPLIATTNQMTTKIIFGDVKEPWHEFNYPNLAEKFPGYKYENGRSYLDDILIGEGGRVYAEPGMYYNVKTFDVASMHPSSIIAENGFGPYTEKFKNLMDIRIAIKHKDFDKVKQIDPRLGKYLNDPAQAKALSFALKIAINSVYGLTAAKFRNKFKDPRNIDNWVAKRGALFMETLRRKVQAMGAKVVHIKTDSIKIEKPTKDVEAFIINYGKEWGYNFEVESVYDRICLVNDAVYIAKCSNDESNGEEAGHWTATGAQFQHPYVFKTLFSKEKVEFNDLCETRSVKTDIWLDMNENMEDVEPYEKELLKLNKQIAKIYNPEQSDEFPEELIKKRDALIDKINSCHDYQFVGRVGSFCPIIPGKGGGILLRKGTDGKFSSVAGSKGWRWLEAFVVSELKYQKYIDMSYFRDLSTIAIETIEKFGNFDKFTKEGLESETPPFDPPYITINKGA